MSWNHAMRTFLSSGTILSMAGGVIATGTYVAYTDYTRYPRMISAYSSGNILAPLDENNYETVYFRRADLERTLRQVLRPQFTNEYFLINGDVGTGKTRTIVELIRDMKAHEGRRCEGAPVYVQVNQGKSFPDTLAAAVQFQFDEHISFKFFLDFVMRVHSFPNRDDDKRLIRVLDAIEKSSFEYMQTTGRPVVLIIDGINNLPRTMPDALERLLEKAKLWADTNTVKMIFVNSDEETESLLQRQSSSWSRQATPVAIDDLSREESIAFLVAPHFMENEDSTQQAVMSADLASSIVDVVGGRIQHLITFKRNWIRGVSIEDTVEELKERERVKFLNVSRAPSAWKAVRELRSSPGGSMLLSKIIKHTSLDDVEALARAGIIRYHHDRTGTAVRFRSTLTANVVVEMQQIYEDEKRKRK